METKIESSISIEEAARLVGTNVSSIERLAQEKRIKSHRNKNSMALRFFESDLRKSFKLNSR